MLAGLHPGLLLSGRKITFEGVPGQLYISTQAGEGNRDLGLFLELKNGTAPYSFYWSISAGAYPVTPSSGNGVSNTSTVQFSAQAYVSGSLADYSEVGEATLEVYDANGRYAYLRVPVFAGQ